MNPFLMSLLQGQQSQPGQDASGNMQSPLSGFDPSMFLNPFLFPQGKNGQSNQLMSMLGLQPFGFLQMLQHPYSSPFSPLGMLFGSSQPKKGQ